MLTVACVYSGGRYSRGWIEKLERGVARHMNMPHRFVCLGRDAPLERGWPGWWSKIELFRAFRGETLYLDLDVLVLGGLDPLITAARACDGIVMMREMPRQLPNSSVMYWRGDRSEIYDVFAAAPERYMEQYGGDQWPHYSSFGDQAFIADRCTPHYWSEITPPTWIHAFSFDGRPTLDAPDPDARLSVCLGDPKFDRYPDMPLVKDNWI